MSLFDAHADAPALAAQLARDGGQRVVCYCAAWCRSCTAYRPALQELAARWPQWTFIWVDVEELPHWLGDEDVDDFPTILIQDAAGTRFWGPQPAQIAALERLLGAAAQLPVQAELGPGPVDTLARA